MPSFPSMPSFPLIAPRFRTVPFDKLILRFPLSAISISLIPIPSFPLAPFSPLSPFGPTILSRLIIEPSENLRIS